VLKLNNNIKVQMFKAKKYNTNRGEVATHGYSFVLE
jgi:hypothetical protein